MGGGVGEAYPGSTGGEIFNCYEGTNRNVASGNYASCSGEKNKALGNHTMVGGYNNIANHGGEAIFGANNIGRGGDTFIAGNNNTIRSNDSEMSAGSIVLGSRNTDVSGFVIGRNNSGNAGDASSKSGYLFGNNLAYFNNKDGSYNSLTTVVIGENNTNTTLIRPSVVLACGDFSNPFNGLELTRNDCKINTNLQLASDATVVNAITPAKSSPASADDMTLVTKSYVDSQITSKSLSYQPVSEQQLNIYTSYSIATLLGQATWDFPFSGGGSMDFVFSYGSTPNRNIWYRCHVPLPSYLNIQNTPKINVALAQISHYPVTDDSNGELQGILLEYDTAAKTIQFIGGEGVIVNNGPDTLQTAYAQGDLHPWFWGLTCNSYI